MSLCPQIFPLHMSHAVLNSDASKGLRSASLSIPLSCSNLGLNRFQSTKRTRHEEYVQGILQKNSFIILRVLQINLNLMTAFYMATASIFFSAKKSTRALSAYSPQAAPLFPTTAHPYYYRSFYSVGKHARMSQSVTHRRRLRLRRVRSLVRPHVQQGNNRRVASEGGAARPAETAQQAQIG